MRRRLLGVNGSTRNDSQPRCATASCIARKRGNDKPQPAGEGMRGQPAKQAGVVVVLKLVERVEHQDAAHSVVLCLAARLGQPEGEVAQQVVVGARRILGIVLPALDLGDEPGHQPPVVCTVRRAADVVLEEEVVGVLAAPVLEPVGHQRRLAVAGVADEDERPAVACRVPVELGKVVGAADVGAAANFGKGLVVARLAGERVGDICDGELRLDCFLEVLEDERGQSARVGVLLAQRNVLSCGGASDDRLERRLIVRGTGVFREEIRAARQGVGRVAEVEERAPGHLRVVEHAMQNFQFCDAFAGEAAEPRLLFLQVGSEGVGARRPAVALAQQANEERAAGADFVEAELEGLLAVLCSSAMPQRRSTSTSSTWSSRQRRRSSGQA